MGMQAAPQQMVQQKPMRRGNLMVPHDCCVLFLNESGLFIYRHC